MIWSDLRLQSRSDFYFRIWPEPAAHLGDLLSTKLALKSARQAAVVRVYQQRAQSVLPMLKKADAEFPIPNYEADAEIDEVHRSTVGLHQAPVDLNQKLTTLAHHS
jgi:hypothetical protein